MSNWYQEAVKSENEHIRNLVKEYDEAEPKSAKRVEIKNAILVLMGTQENPFNVKEVKEETKEEKEEAETDFMLTAEDIKALDKKEDLLACIEEIEKKADELENGRLMHQTFRQKIDLNRKIWSVKRLGFVARLRLRELRAAAKKAEKKGKVTQKQMKKNKFINLYRQGYSFTNISKDPDGVKKEELLEVVDEDVIKACKNYNRYFVEDWNRWVNKFLKKEE